jgi:hypothetical protein
LASQRFSEALSGDNRDNDEATGGDADDAVIE